jgi:hypothetical protein
MADFIDSQTAVIFAIVAVVIIWFLSFPNLQKKKEPKNPWDYHL